MLSDNILRIEGLTSKVGLSRSTIYDKMNPKSPRYDKDFPRPIKLSLNAVGWFEQDILTWLKTRSVANY
ncbi:AlpA family phage regulatory protein [Acinetobacter towneri]|uniref:helix-turn-helix transcriptional regulator n=1 Tax=Acinetobacter TaxID=469 RepID=UPI0015D36A4D|nr:AlpA family phage regulatory protein [Acinetobacter towneri]MCA4778385.1 AlpA family phage regulatory protein [Acinetobacter towneri]MCA4783713.1 AlpA family phage regulatory protein [Acinetobacter towneri]MCA4786938.1 AlpA family phage regulatory protein [Acinetobacter towneri]MCA4795050.1 AlpA family phage regulatory protein [Acinetobacter towneri]MCA4799945.1 AlpA family phage regulatory protein [Acinetobacter towneri]